MSAAFATTDELPNGWKSVAIGDVAMVVNGGTPKSSVASYWDGDVQWLTPKDMGRMTDREISSTPRTISQTGLQKSSARLVPSDSIILSTRAPIGHLAVNTDSMAFNQGCKGLVVGEKLHHLFLFYFLEANRQTLNDLGSGATFKELSGTSLKSVRMPLPPVDEQKRIVAVLDQAFAALDRARAHAEQNLRDATAVFDSVLSSVEGEQRLLGSLVSLRTGKLDANAAVEHGPYPFFTCAREIYAIDRFAFDCEAILLAGNNAVGDFNVKHYQGKFNAYQRTYVITVNDTKQMLYRYLYFQLVKSLKHFKQQSVGAGTKFLKLGMINGLNISVPTVAQQQRTVTMLDSLLEETQLLEAYYTSKLANITNLRQSLLQKAFSGQLT